MPKSEFLHNDHLSGSLGNHFWLFYIDLMYGSLLIFYCHNISFQLPHEDHKPYNVLHRSDAL